MKSIWTIIAGVGLAFGLAGSLAVAGEAEDVAAVREATAKYMDIDVALAEGFVPAGECVSAAAEGLPAEWGAMGIHYINPGILKITAQEPRVDGMSTHVDFLKPAILMYEPQADGSLELIGVENVVFQKAWAEAGHAEPPSFAGVVWDTMADDPNTAGDEAHQFAPHYDRHVWTPRENPAGVFSPFNANVTCENAQ